MSNDFEIDNIVFNGKHRGQEASVTFIVKEVQPHSLITCEVVCRLGGQRIGRDQKTTLLPTKDNATAFFKDALKTSQL